MSARRIFALAFVTVVALVAVTVSTLLPARGIPADLLSQVPRESPFLERQYRTPVAAPVETLMTVVQVLAITGHHNDATLVRGIVARRTLKHLLDEPYSPTGTLATAIGVEATEPESIDKLHQRVIDRVTLERALTEGNPRIAPQGDEKANLYVRLKGTNGLTKPALPEMLDLRADRAATLRCAPETGTAIPARAAAMLHCSAAGHKVRLENTLAALQSAQPGLQISRLQIEGEPTLTLTSAGVFPGGLQPRYLDEARRQIAAADCKAVMACEEMAHRRRAEFQNRIPQLAYLLSVVLAAGLVGAACLLVPRRAPAGTLLVAFLTGAAAVASAVEVLLVYAAMYPKSFVVFLLWRVPNVGFALALTQLVSAVALAAALGWKREEVTRLRIFVLGMAAMVFLGTIFVLFHSR